MLDTRLPVRDKIGVAQAVADLVERTPRGQMPDVSQAFVDAEVAGADADRASAELVRRLEDVLTRSFRRVFLVAASLALLAAVPAMAAAVTVAAPRSPARRPAWIGAAALGAVVAAAGGLVVAEARAGAGDIGEVVEADPCAASADPYSGDGLDPTLQRIALGALNGAACDLGVSRERLVLSLADVPGSGSVSLDRDAIESALEARSSARSTTPTSVAACRGWWPPSCGSPLATPRSAGSSTGSTCPSACPREPTTAARRRRRSTVRQRAAPRSAPPSTTIVWPVIHDARSLARNRAALAMSAGSPSRRSGIRAAIASSAGSHSARAKSVLTRPGAMALTRTWGARSAASVRVRWRRAALVTL
jgi:hypothetical protein